mmetsp:Transcript_20449/g.45373  ORF Transcript_20449/g.45373 Transcript_20449/m.45373 type:complete len:214 (+) Transcript_20449:1582-2223(+)
MRFFLYPTSTCLSRCETPIVSVCPPLFLGARWRCGGCVRLGITWVMRRGPSGGERLLTVQLNGGTLFRRLLLTRRKPAGMVSTPAWWRRWRSGACTGRCHRRGVGGIWISRITGMHSQTLSDTHTCCISTLLSRFSRSSTAQTSKRFRDRCWPTRRSWRASRCRFTGMPWCSCCVVEECSCRACCRTRLPGYSIGRWIYCETSCKRACRLPRN